MRETSTMTAPLCTLRPSYEWPPPRGTAHTPAAAQQRTRAATCAASAGYATAIGHAEMRALLTCRVAAKAAPPAGSTTSAPKARRQSESEAAVAAAAARAGRGAAASAARSASASAGRIAAAWFRVDRIPHGPEVRRGMSELFDAECQKSRITWSARVEGVIGIC
jgi:hypothetical protein